MKPDSSTFIRGVICAAFLFLGCNSPPVEVAVPPPSQEPKSVEEKVAAESRFVSPDFRKGISLGLFAHDATTDEQKKIYAKLIDEIAQTGATDVMIALKWHQTSVTSSDVFRGDKTPEDDVVREIVKRAKSAKLDVTIMPYIHLETRGPKLWRGTLRPTDRESWWKSYRTFILHYAALASELEVDGYVVGSELLSMERDRKKWRGLISDVRKASPESWLTYSANWDRFETVRFWDALDVIGISAYPPVGKPTDLESTYAKNWSWFTRTLNELRRRVPNKRVLFTEIGYPSISSAAARPWDHTSTDPIDLAQQERLYRAMFGTWSQRKYVDGMFVWNWFGFGGTADRGYTPRGKPAADVLKAWYGATAR